MKFLHNTDETTMAYINLYGVLGALEELCQLDARAKGLIEKANVGIGIRVKGGPDATLRFQDGKCKLEKGTKECNILLPFTSPKMMNGLMDGTTTPIPMKGILKTRFLLNEFKSLTGILSGYLQPTDEDLQKGDFFVASTVLTFYVIAVAISEIGNHDKIGKESAKYIDDGIICMSIKGGPSVGICVKHHRLHTVKHTPKNPQAYMEFENFQTARALFEGKKNAMECIGKGEVRVGGMLPMVDNMNRILDRVGLYLS